MPDVTIPTPAKPVEDVKETNHLLADQADLQARLTVATGAEREELKAQATELRLIANYKRAGLSDTEAAIRAEAVLEQLEARRTAAAKSSAIGQLGRFAEGAGIGRTGGGVAAIGGLIAGSVVAGVADLAKQGLDYAEDLKVVSDQLGLTTRDLQVYQSRAAQVGVTTDQLRESFAQLSGNIGKAQEGSQQQGKIFSALNVDVGNAKEGYRSLSDVLPTLIDRLSQIPDKAQRVAIETALGGEQLAKLDPILSGGTASLSTFAAALQRTGGIMADRDIQDADKTALKVKLLGDQLERDLSTTVSQNAAAIEQLANAFFRAADGALKFFSRIQVNGDLDALNSPLIAGAEGLVTGKGKEGVRRDAFSDALNSPYGRQQLLARNTAQLNALNAADKSGILDIFAAPGLDAAEGDTPQARYKLHQQFIAERARILAADRAADAAVNSPPAPVQQGSVNRSALASVFAPKPPKGKSADQIAAEADARTERFTNQMASLEDEAIRARERQTGDINAQADAEKQLLDRTLKRQLADIATDQDRNVRKGADPALEADRARQLTAAAQAAHDAEVAANEQQRQADLARAATDHQATLLTIQSEQLSAEAALATTAKQRRDIAHKQLANEEEQERVRLQGIISAAKSGSPEAADAQAQLNSLHQRYVDKGKAQDIASAPPLDAYLHQLHEQTDDLNVAFQNVAADGVQSMVDGLSQAIAHGKSLRDVLKNVGAEIASELIKLAIEKSLASAFGDPAAGTSGDGFGSIVTSIGRALGLSGARAAGGPVSAGGTYLVGERGPEILRLGAQGGTVVPNSAIGVVAGNVQPTGGASPIHQHFYIDASNSVNPDGWEERTLDKAAQRAAQLAAAAGQQAVVAGPAYLASQQKLRG